MAFRPGIYFVATRKDANQCLKNKQSNLAEGARGLVLADRLAVLIRATHSFET